MSLSLRGFYQVLPFCDQFGSFLQALHLHLKTFLLVWKSQSSVCVPASCECECGGRRRRGGRSVWVLVTRSFSAQQLTAAAAPRPGLQSPACCGPANSDTWQPCDLWCAATSAAQQQYIAVVFTTICPVTSESSDERPAAGRVREVWQAAAGAALHVPAPWPQHLQAAVRPRHQHLSM